MFQENSGSLGFFAILYLDILSLSGNQKHFPNSIPSTWNSFHLSTVKGNGNPDK
jgi:hypothetical protein